MAGMENKSSDLRLNLPRLDRQNQKRLIFDRRYGWVFDEWKDPAEEALSGGRGMFCVVPIAKGLLRMASQSDGESGWSSLHRALHFGHLAVASVLMQAGASLTLE